MNDNQPFETIRIGRIKATIWENENEQGRTYHSVTLARNYRDEDGQWQETNSFSVDDMPRLRMASDRAFDSIYARQQQLHFANRSNQEKETETPEEDKATPARKTAAKKKSAAQKIIDERKDQGTRAK
jgi:hypothetical protein